MLVTAITLATVLLLFTTGNDVDAFYGSPINPPSYVNGYAKFGPLSGIGYGGGFDGGYGYGCGIQQCGYSGYNAGYGGLGAADYNNFAYGPNSIYGLYDNPYAGGVIGGPPGGSYYGGYAGYGYRR